MLIYVAMAAPEPFHLAGKLAVLEQFWVFSEKLLGGLPGQRQRF